MASSIIKCPHCGVDFMRTHKQVNVVIKRSGEWQCKKCTLLKRNLSGASPIGATRVHNSNGYVLEKKEWGWVRQHVFLMEQHLGRKILPSEAVHHINFIKSDNRIENLAVMNHGDHTRLHNLERSKNGKYK
jgi:ribosomal protein S27AE